MEQAGKRKRENDGAVDVGKRAKAEDGNGNGCGETVTDAEVDEFFAILRRIHVAVKYFEKGNGGVSRELTAMEKRWMRKPSFEVEDEDFGEDKSVKDDGRRQHLDLNLAPSSKSNGL